MQELLGYVDAENCRHPVYNTVCTVCNAVVSIHCILRAFSLLSHYLVTLTFSLLSLSHYHFLATARLEFPPSLFEHFSEFLFRLFRLFSTFRYVPVVLATLHFEKAWKVAIISESTRKLRLVSKSYASCLEIVVFEVGVAK